MRVSLLVFECVCVCVHVRLFLLPKALVCPHAPFCSFAMYRRLAEELTDLQMFS